MVTRLKLDGLTLSDTFQYFEHDEQHSPHLTNTVLCCTEGDQRDRFG